MARRLRALSLLFALLAIASPSRAADLDLSWDQCVAVSGTPVVHRIATAPGSYAITLNARNLTGRIEWASFVFELRSPDGLPAAWRFDSPGCNAGGLQFVTSTGSKTCPGPGGLTNTVMTYTLDPSGRAAVLTVAAIFNNSNELVAATNYVLGRVLLDFTSATPTGSGIDCEGLDAPVCITLVEAKLQRAGQPASEVPATGTPFLTWNDPDGLTACSGRSLQGTRVEEFMTACATFVAGSQFLELTPSIAGSTLPGELKLRTEDAGGAVLADVDVIPAERAGEPWAAGGSWLLGTALFTENATLTPDRTLPAFLAPGAGRIVLYDGRPGGPVLQDLRYGGAEPIVAPTPGHSVVLTPNGYQASATPMPRNFSGEETAGIDCPIPQAAAPFAIRQVAYSCYPGSAAGQFVEIESLTDSAWTGNLLLEVLDEGGNRLAQRGQLFGSSTSGTIVPGKRTWIIATSAFQSATGLTPDAVWTGFAPVPLTRFRLYRPQNETIDQVTIGPGGMATVPSPGTSVRFLPDNSSVVQFPPDPRNAVGQLLPGSTCFPADSSWTDDFSRVRFSELSTRCEYADEGAQFLELRADGPGQLFDSHAAIEIFAASGTLTATLTGQFGAHPDGSGWPEGQTWLLAKADFPAGSGFPADGSCPRLDPAGGRVRLYDTRLSSRTIDEIRYGPGTALPSLPPRQSIQRDPDGTLTVKAPLSPTNSQGQTTDSLDCPYPLALVRISEISTRCEDGGEGSQFIELRSEGRDQIHDSHAVLQVFAADGDLIATRSGLFGASPDGTAWPEGRTWLLAKGEFANGAGFAADGSCPRLDPVGGRIRLYDSRLPQRTIDEISYGPGTSLPAPPGGQSIQRALNGTVMVAGPVSPTKSTGQSTSSPGCPCPHAEYNWSNVFRATDAVTYDSTYVGRQIRFNRAQPSILIRYVGSSAGVTLPDRFVVTGAPAGQEVVIIGMFKVAGGGGGGCGAVHGCSGGSGALTWTSADTSGTIGSWSSVNQQYLMTLRVRIGEPFPFSWRLAVSTFSNGSSLGEANFSATFEWANLPPGTHMESCMGYFDDTPVATLPTLLQSSVEPGVVRLEWSAPGADVTSVAVERRTETSDWIALATVESPARGSIPYEDRAVEAGGRYAYRISWSGVGGVAHSVETWIDVPAGALAFAARLADGTLARAPFALALSLPSRETVSIELFDLRGRRLAGQSWTPEQAGTAEVRFAPDRVLAPGVYWIRVAQGTERATLRALVLGAASR